MDLFRLKHFVREVGKVYRGRVDPGRATLKGAYFAGDGCEKVHHWKTSFVYILSFYSPQNNLRPKRAATLNIHWETDAEALGSGSLAA